MLELVRLERQASEALLYMTPDQAEEDWELPESLPNAEVAGMVESEDDEDSDEDYEEDEVRTIVVRTSPFATWVDVTRFGIRKMDKVPRTYNPTRALARLEGRVRVQEAGTAQPAQLRAYVRRLIREHRPAIKECIAEHLRQDPRILIDEPSGLVFEQALLFDDGVRRFSLDVSLKDGTPTVRAVARPDTPVDEDTEQCLGEALAHASDSVPETGPGARIHAPLVVFIQAAVAAEDAGMARGLAMESAMLGWLHYERGEFLEAREAFRDAAWAYHLPEFQALVGRAEDALGRSQEAIEAYQRYVDERPDAPDTPELSARIETLRASDEG